jgi:hypothetical protein
MVVAQLAQPFGEVGCGPSDPTSASAQCRA